ncbi:tail fiber assembly protein [Wohlfahrtiimonas larvae]|uniref:Phage tail protein n=1 Tax=Wohlfahrtiimonas larvae TaxID=1157986 RepID=A0ABP9MPD8_9GAMM
MNTKHFKDSQNNTFGLDTTSENWKSFIREDWIEITIDEARAIANPPPTQQELDQQQEVENIDFLSSETRRTSDVIAILDDAIEFEIATDEEIAQHKELRKYRLMLSRVPNQETWPLNPTWPTCPEFFKTKE